jgi:hypothetical protein
MSNPGLGIVACDERDPHAWITAKHIGEGAQADFFVALASGERTL